MSGIQIFGIILIVLGLLALIYQGITYTTHEQVLKLGPIEATAEKKKTIPLPPIIGAVMIIGGILMVTLGPRNRSA